MSHSDFFDNKEFYLCAFEGRLGLLVFHNRKQNVANEEVRNVQTLFDCSNEIEKYECNTCSNFQTNFSATLQYHVSSGHKDKNLEEYVYKCLKCLFVTHSKYLMGRHSLFSECVASNEEEKKNRFVCYRTTQMECNFRSKDKRKTLFHQESTNTNLAKSDPSSKKLFAYTQSTDIVRFQNKQSKYLTENATSSRSMAQETRSFECEQCSSKFKQKQHLKAHIMYIHSKPEDVSWFKCEQCTYRCKAKSNLTKHVNVVHSKLVDWHQCEQCAFKFKNQYNLKQHKILYHMTSENIVWFECEQCSYKCKRKGDLKKHVKRRHPKREDI